MSNLDLIVSLTVFGNDGKSLEIQAQIDTGFDGSLTLPPESIEILNLSLAGEARISLADGSIVQQEVYSGTVLWDETGRRTFITSVDADSLIGTQLLEGFELQAQFQPNGRLTIRKL